MFVQAVILTIILIQMSAKKDPKPFLKKGTRQYLSNATVRSLNQKPKIVDFEEQSNDFDLQKTQQINTITFGKKQEQELKIQLKKTNAQRHLQQRVAANTQNSKPKQKKALNEQKLTKNDVSANKKKPALLQDYIGGASSHKNTNLNRNSLSKEKAAQLPSRNVKSMVGTLQRQEEQLDSSGGQKVQSQINIPNKSSQNILINTKANFPPRVIEKKSPIPPKVQADVAQKIYFKQESDEESLQHKKQVLTKKPQNIAKNKQKVTKYSSNSWQQEQQEPKEKEPALYQQPRGPSKLLQKYYKKQPVLPQKMAKQQAKLQLKDIPREVQQQIINEYLNDKKSQISKKLDELNQLTTKARKQRQKLQEENKQLNKAKEEFNKEMEEKSKEFQQKLKSQNSKLNREKKYMKDHQTSGKADWKQKVELQQLKSKLEQSQAQKKKLKSDLQRQIDRLKKKVDQVLQQNSDLKQQMKYLEMQKIETRQKSRQIDKKVQQKKQINYWEGAPTKSYFFSFADHAFSLFDFQPIYYNMESLEHYQYYLSKRQQECELQREEPQTNGKIVRRYKNGKEEVEYVSTVLKQNFPAPFKFSVVTHLNGDIKLIYPNGMVVFFDSRNNITQFKVNNQKAIHHFHKLGQIQMKFRHHQQGQIHELRKGNMMIRRTRNSEEKLKKCENGMIQRLG